MNARDAAQKIADLMTELETAGIVTDLSSVTVTANGENMISSCGWSEGGPWVVLTTTQRTSPRGIIEN